MVKLYVEGGGDAASLKTACREGFSTFLQKAGLKGHMPRIVACGSRQNAYESFCTAIENGEPAFLLVDSEAPVHADCQPGQPGQEKDLQQWLPWRHLKHRQGDGWEKPAGAEDIHCHLMVQCMESWFLADRPALQSFFGHGFKNSDLPVTAHTIESVAKTDIFRSLANATRDCKTKTPYGKGEHSFKLLSNIAPAKVVEASPWARRLVNGLKTRMGT